MSYEEITLRSIFTDEMEGCAKIMYIRVRRGAQTVPLPRLPANCGQFTIIYDLPTRRRPSSPREMCVDVCA